MSSWTRRKSTNNEAKERRWATRWYNTQSFWCFLYPLLNKSLYLFKVHLEAYCGLQWQLDTYGASLFFCKFFFVLVELWVRGRFLYGLGESHRHYQLPTEPNAFSAQLFRWLIQCVTAPGVWVLLMTCLWFRTKTQKKSAFKYKQMANSPGSSLAAMTEEGRMSSVS